MYVAEQPQQSKDDQIGRDDVVQQPGHYQDQDARDQRYQRPQRLGDVHGCILFLIMALIVAGRTALARQGPVESFPSLDSERLLAGSGEIPDNEADQGQ